MRDCAVLKEFVCSCGTKFEAMASHASRCSTKCRKIAQQESYRQRYVPKRKQNAKASS